ARELGPNTPLTRSDRVVPPLDTWRATRCDCRHSNRGGRGRAVSRERAPRRSREDLLWPRSERVDRVAPGGRYRDRAVLCEIEGDHRRPTVRGPMPRVFAPDLVLEVERFRADA